ncbi:hypothetical protein P170DRAFT_505180 [Aspergillus steynii IBT 23096]|uniref:Uncharacterized protein n=1 Tax=Aspergillus steynii IBT 23096 TaxID=1392250 RepID=A0A2I2GNG2_9EURO|nr:uncharacterized protein P170DRAFT_505180 [Aspergillus steynii IBT 23096]PLB54417.1 hypothetical protein P170DRAFT_505180 [Aspergillus steynii IBT 23096]
MTFNFDLGTETFSLATSDLDFILHASAVISTPPGTWNPWSTESFRKELVAGSIWVDNDASLQLHLYISFDAESELSSSRSRFVSRLGDILCKSKFWSELGLEASSADYNDGSHGHYPPTSHLSFNLRKSNRTSTILKTSRIPAALQSPGDAPPIDICPTVFLSTVKVRLEYTRSSLPTCHLLPSCPIPETALAPIRHTGYSHQKIAFVPQSPETAIQFEQAQICPDQPQSVAKELEAFHCLIPETDLHPAPNYLSSSKELSTLISAALETMIVGESSHKCPPKVQSSSKQALVPISRIAPSIFSPGYREVSFPERTYIKSNLTGQLMSIFPSQSVNQRVQLIPSIAKSLSSIIKHSRDPSLQNKAIIFQSSGEPESESEVSSNARARTATVSLKSRLKASLWRVAANQVRTMQGTRKRSPLIPAPTMRAESEDEQSFEDEILFAATPPEENLYSQDTGISEDGGCSDQYLGTEEEVSVSGESEASSFLAMDEERSDSSEDLFSYQDSEMNQVARPYKSIFIPGDSMCQSSQQNWEMLSNCLDYPESPLLLSDQSALFEEELFEEACDKMLCE